jgi:class 3 adenylate cyclase
VFELRGPDREQLQTLLRDYNEYPERRREIVRNIERQFRHTVAILVADSCGFSRTVQQQGIIHFLALLERLERLVLPVIQSHGGRLLREEADNFFAIFPDAAKAVACADEICRNVKIANGPLPAANEIYVAIGVGFGDVLLVGDDDIFGDEMNVTCKLGEDLAQQDEILLTENAYAALGATEHEFEELNFTVSGIEVKAFRLVRPTASA